MMNKQRKTSNILNVFQYDETTGAVTLPSTLVLTAPAGSDNSTKVPTTAWTRSYVSGLNYLTGNQTITVSGDVSGSGTTSLNLTLANSGVTAGTYTKVTVDSKGRITVGAGATTSDISEGSNLYYTDARVLAYLGANNYATQSYVSSQIANLVSSAPLALDTLNELAAALGNDPSFATTTATSLGNRLRIDIGTQGLTSTQQGYGRTNLGLGTAATSAIGDFATAAQGTKADTAFGWGNHASAGYLTSATAATTYASLTGSYANPSWITSLAYSKITGVPAFLTSYTETDTLASVTGRGASTSTAVTFSGGASISNLLINGAPAIAESSLALGAMGTGEGGQLTLNKATSYTYAGHIDIWQDVFRILYGTNTATSGVAMSLNLSTRQLILPQYTTSTTFTGTAAGVLAFDSSGNILTIAVPSGAVSSVNAGTGISVNATIGAVTVTNTGTLTVAGTANQVLVNGGSAAANGNLTLSLPQNIHTSASPTFDQVITGNNGNGTNFRIGDDVWIGDVNLANTFRVQGVQNAANGYIIFGNGDSTALGRASTGALTYGGNTVYHAGNLTNLNQLTNGPGYITGITSSNVTTALGYTPYNSTNPSGYITGITSSMVTTALGYTPYNSTNPNGYITSSGNISGYAMSLNGYANQTEYIILTGPANGPVIKVRYDSATANRYIDIGSKDGNGVYSEGLKIYNGGTLTFGGNTIWHQGNLTNLNQLSNGPGYLTSITSSQVITALGYTPYNGSTNPNGYITGVTNISGYSGTLSSNDIRTLSPSSLGASRLAFGFTSWANNNTANYADYLHFRSYSDASGGADNLVMFLKSGIGMRIWQQTWGSSTAYSSYVDVLHSSNYNAYSPTLTGGSASGTWGINVTGSSRSLLFSGDSTKQITDNQWAGGGSYPGYVFTGGNSRFGFSSTSGVIDVYTDGNFYATDSSYLVWHQGNLTNLNQLTNGPGYISAGSTLTGYVNTANGDFAIVNSTSGTGTSWIGRTGVRNSSGDKAVFLGTYNSYAIVGAHNYALTAWADLLVNCVNNNGDGGTTRLSSSSYVGSNVILHAGNYTSYAIGYTNLAASFGLNDNKLYLRTNGDNNHFLWNADDDWEELRYYTGTGFRIQGSTGSVPAYFTNAGIYAAAFRGKDNVAGTGEAVYAPAGLYSTGNNWLYGTMYQNGNIIRDNGGIVQNSIVGRPNAQWGATGATGPVIISFPGNTGNYGMVHAVIDIYEYNGNNVCTIIVGGHNWGGSQWYNYGAQVIGYTDKPVRVGIKDGRYCIIIGNSGSSWSYGQVVLRKIQNGSYYSGIMDVGAGYSVGIGSDSYTWASSDLRDFRTSSSATINGYLTVRGAGTSASIYMSDDDEGQREIHCNSNRIGFLTQAGAWGSWCDDSGNWGVTGSVNAADGSFGTGSSDQGIYINYTNYVSGYGRIRFKQDGSNHSTIHSFSASWQSSSAYAASTGCINIDGQYGTTIGPWNAHHAAITSEGIAIKSSATPSGAMGWNGSAVLRLQQGSTGDNVFLQFRNRADAGDYAGLLFADNNIGGYLGFRTYASNDVANGSDCMIYGTYNDHIFQNGTSGTFNGKTETFRIYGNGSVRATGDVTAYSDIRVKENILTIDNALEKTLKLRGVYYNRTDKDDKSQKIGVIAQEIQQVLPQVVSEDYNGLLSVSYGNITGVLIEAIKEQQKQIEELTNKINLLIQNK